MLNCLRICKLLNSDYHSGTISKLLQLSTFSSFDILKLALLIMLHKLCALWRAQLLNYFESKIFGIANTFEYCENVISLVSEYLYQS